MLELNNVYILQKILVIKISYFLWNRVVIQFIPPITTFLKFLFQSIQNNH